MTATGICLSLPRKTAHPSSHRHGHTVVFNSGHQSFSTGAYKQNRSPRNLNHLLNILFPISVFARTQSLPWPQFLHYHPSTYIMLFSCLILLHLAISKAPKTNQASTLCNFSKPWLQPRWAIGVCLAWMSMGLHPGAHCVCSKIRNTWTVIPADDTSDIRSGLLQSPTQPLLSHLTNWTQLSLILKCREHWHPWFWLALPRFLALQLSQCIISESECTVSYLVLKVLRLLSGSRVDI